MDKKNLLPDVMQYFSKEDRPEYFEKMDQVSALVLCKSELFFQSANGKTLFTLWPIHDETAVFIATLLAKPVMLA